MFDNVELPADDVFQILSSRRRRQVLYICRRSSEPLTLSELAEEIAAFEEGKPIGELTSTERKRIYNSLQQTHLPVLSRAGLIEYDGRTISLTEEGSTVMIYLDVVSPGNISWGVYYFGLSTVLGVTVGGAAFGIYPTEIPDLAWSVLVVIVFWLSSIAHLYTTGQLRLERLPVYQ